MIDNPASLLSTAGLNGGSVTGEPGSLDAARKAAKEFESFFVGYVFEMAYQSIEKSDFLGQGAGDDLYKSMFIQQVSAGTVASGRGLGLADQLAPQIAPSIQPAKTEAPVPSAAGEAFSLPVTRVSSGFGPRLHPLGGHSQFHKGMDLAFPMRTPIKAAADGTVIFSGVKSGYGKTVVVRHADDYTTLYAHNDENSVRVGDKVVRGQVIGFTGNTGRTTGPHLHFELQRSGQVVDPSKYVTFEKIV